MADVFRGLNLLETLKESIESNRLSDVKEAVEDLLISRINLAVVGDRGEEKASFMNSLHGLGADDEGAVPYPTPLAPEGLAGYPNPKHPDFRLWDLPPVPEISPFEPEGYMNRYKFLRYNAVFITSTQSVQPNSVEVFLEALSLQRQTVYFIILASAKDSEKILEEKKKVSLEVLKSKGVALPKIYLIQPSTLEKFDFPSVLADMSKDLPEIRAHALVLALPILTSTLVTQKKEAFKALVWAAASLSGGVSAIPVPLVASMVDSSIGVRILTKAQLSLCLDNESVERLARQRENPCLLTFEEPKNVNENDNVTLTCSTLSSCPSDPKIEDTLPRPSSLSRKSQNLKGTTLSFKATWEDDGRIFSCQTENNKDTCLIRNISLTVGYAPKNVSAKISSTNVKEGQSVTLTCIANGQPKPSVTWIKNNDVQSIEASWTIPSVNESHSGSYHCEAQNTHGSKESGEVILNVTYGPDVGIQILQEPKRSPEEIIQGDRVTFTCFVKRSNPPPHSFTWSKNNLSLKWNQTHVVERIEPEDSGNYICKAENTVGSGSKPLELWVLYKPRKTKISFHNRSVKINELLSLTCETDAYPRKLSYSWYRYNKTDRSRKIFMSSQNPLNIVKVQRADEACYICNASNIVDRGDTSDEVCIQVLFPPNNVKMDMTNEVTEGQPITVSCTAESFPPSSFTLTRSTSSSSTPEEIMTLSTFPYTFNATSADAGFYTCKATNSEGSNSSLHEKLLVKYTPKEVKVEAHPGLVVKENESLTLDCSAKSYPSVSSVTWIKMTRETNESTKSTQRTFTVKSVSVADSGLYSCTAENEIGSGKSEQVEITVKHGPKYTKIIKGQEVQIDDVTYMALSCISHCYPPVKQYSWYRRTDEKENEYLSNQQNITVNSKQSGEYYCIAVNEIGKRASEPIKPFDGIVMKILMFFLPCLILLIFCIFLYRCKRSRFIQQETTNAWPRSGCLGWRNGVSRSRGNRGVVAEPFRSRDDLLPDQPCRPNAQQRQHHPDSTTASNINTIYSTVNLPKGKQAASAQNPIKEHSGHMENDSLNYTSLYFVNKKKDPEEDVEYSVVSKPKKSKENKQERLEDYENISTVNASKPPYTYDFDTDTDTSEDEVEVNYTQVNFKAQSGHQRARKDSSSSTEDETQYSEVKI